MEESLEFEIPEWIKILQKVLEDDE